MALKIPVFLSSPSILSAAQEAIYDEVRIVLDEERLQPRALGRSDFPQSDPITEVYYIIRACYGGVILGFSQITFQDGVMKGGTPAEQPTGPMSFPTPWNQIEAGMLVALRLPLLVFAERGVSGGIFDQGAFPGYLQRLTPASHGQPDREATRERVRNWASEVRARYRK
jgi:hypothetical protein